MSNILASDYHYEVFYSVEDHCYIGTCKEFESLSAFSDFPEQARLSIEELVDWTLEDLRTENEPIPFPIGLMEELVYKPTA